MSTSLTAAAPPLANVFDRVAFEQLRRERRLDPQLVRRFRTDLFKHFLSDEAALATFAAADRVAIHVLELAERRDSTIDGATKLLWRTASGAPLESVILRVASGRTTLCVSSQSGCAAACAFCATGKMKSARDLSAAEILDQVLRAGQTLAGERRRLRNLVFMGMGEPLHNEENLYAALDALTAPDMFGLAPTRILVSTVGVADAMARCVERFPRVNMALSLHSVRQDVREQLVPLARKYPLPMLRETLRELNAKSAAPVMIEYLLLAGRNDAATDATELIEWLSGLRTHVNLIPYNPIAEAPELAGSDRATREAFAARLKAAGIPTTLRYSLGQDIAAACGQLARRKTSERSDNP